MARACELVSERGVSGGGGCPSSSWILVAVAVFEDRLDDGVLGDEGEDLHGSSAPSAGQRVDLIDTVEGARPIACAVLNSSALPIAE